MDIDAALDRLSPFPHVLRRGWWLAASLLTVAVTIASLAAYAVALPAPPVSPIYLPLGIGVAVLARWGRSLWPAFVLGDGVGQLLAGDRPVRLIALSLLPHVVTLLLGAYLVRRREAWLRDLPSAVRYLAISVALSCLGAAMGLALLRLEGLTDGAYPLAETALLWVFGDLSGYLVAGALIVAWARPGARAELVRPVALASFLISLLICGWSILSSHTEVGVLALLVAGAMSMRFGSRWGSAATAVVLIASLVDAARGTALFGGVTAADQGFNAMLAVAVLASAGLLLAGYREGDGAIDVRPGTASLLTAVTMIVAGVASFGANQLTINRGLPLAMAALFSLGATIGLAFVRGARAPAEPSTRRGLAIAVLAGGIYIVNLVFYFLAVARLGSGPATGLAMTSPAILVVLSAILLRRLPAPLVLVAAVVIALGAMGIVRAQGGASSPVGIALALASAAGFACFILVLRASLRQASPVDVSLVSAFTSAVCGIVAAVIIEGVGAFDLPLTVFGEITIGAIGAGAVPSLMRAWSLPRIGSSVVGALGVLGPVITILLSMALLDAKGGTGQLLGVALIASGGLIAALAPAVAARRGARVVVD